MRIYNSSGGHGIVTRQQLLQDGHTRREIERAAASGHLRRVDRSRYALPGTDPTVVAAAAAGATVTCRSALAMHGLWTMPDTSLHLRRDRYAERHKPWPTGSRRCGMTTTLGDAIVDDVAHALLALHRSHGVQETVMALDSLVRMHGRARTRRIIPDELHHLLARTDRRAESAAESLVRQRLHASRVQLRSQVRIHDVGRVDFLVGRRLIVEVDGHEHHASPEDMARDRRRDRRAMLRGYLVIRITWRMIVDDWDAVERDILALVRSGTHLRRPRALRRR